MSPTLGAMHEISSLLRDLRVLCEGKKRARFYHAGPKGLRPGTVLRPDAGKRSSPAHQFVEEVFEEVRREVAPNAPSRAGAVYVVSEPSSAHVWRGSDDTIYEVELAPGARYHKTDPEMYAEAVFSVVGTRPIRSITSASFTDRHRDSARSYARAYWKPGRGGDEYRFFNPEEILVGGKVLIVKELDLDKKKAE